MNYLTALVSRIGGRNTNQDFAGHRTDEKGGYWVIADGLGGHSGGEVASQLAVEAVLDACASAPELSGDALVAQVKAARKSLQARQEAEPNLASMRTTLVVLAIENLEAVWAHIGDTRLYLFRRGKLIFQTKDHSVPQSLVDAGIIDSEDIRVHVDRNRLLRSLGQAGELRMTLTPTPRRLKPGDAFLLCTDGWWEHVLETEMEVDYALSDTPEGWLSRMEARLQHRVKPRHDNYTAVAVFITE